MSVDPPNPSAGDKPVGVLAFGSLIWDPGCLGPQTQCTIKDVETPWPVEYGRKSSTRCDAPTLVCVEDCWNAREVMAQIRVLDTCDIHEAICLLSRREGCPKGKIDRCPQLERDYAELGAVLYTALEPNLEPSVPADKLARLAVGSCRKLKARGKSHKNGIRYLYKTRQWGVETQLTPEYETAILELCDATTLREAEEKCLQGEC